MFKNWYRLGVSLTTLFVLAFGPAAPSAMADGGVVVLPNGGLYEVCYSAALDPLTGVIALTGFAGSNTLAASLLPSGELNAAFRGGIVLTDVSNVGLMSVSNACAVQPDGKVLSGGWFHYMAGGRAKYGFALVRYNTNGTLDKTFNKSGMVKTKLAETAWINAMVLQPDGKTVVTGRYGGKLITARYTTSGQLDSSFGSGGIVLAPSSVGSSSGSSIALQGDKIIVGATDFSGNNDTMKLIRYSTKGVLDVSFGVLGVASFAAGGSFYGSQLHGIVVDPLDDNSIVAAGKSGDGQRYHLTLARFTSGGILDPSFGNGQGTQGYITFQPEPNDFIAQSVALDGIGRIVTAGYYFEYGTGGSRDHILVARFLDNGTPDPGFNGGVNGGVGYAADFSGDAQSVLVQPDGSIVAAGLIHSDTLPSTSEIVVVRYVDNGTPDLGF